jgi:hypothetical protein
VKINATSPARKVGIAQRVGRLELRAQTEAEQVLLRDLLNALVERSNETATALAWNLNDLARQSKLASRAADEARGR